MKKYYEIMNKDPTYCLSTDTLAQAAQVMRNKAETQVPVIDTHTRHVIGVVRDRDIASRMIAEGRSAKRLRVKAIMIPCPLAGHEEDATPHPPS